MPEEKIVSRYERAMELVKDIVKVSDICHIYDNSADKPFRIFKKKKEECYFDICEDWYEEDVKLLTNVYDAKFKKIN